MTTTRSNKQTEILFTGADGTSHADRIYGNGYGAHIKMMDRAIVALTGWKPANTRCEFGQDEVTLVSRQTGERHTYSVVTN